MTGKTKEPRGNDAAAVRAWRGRVSLAPVATGSGGGGREDRRRAHHGMFRPRAAAGGDRREADMDLGVAPGPPARTGQHVDATAAGGHFLPGIRGLCGSAVTNLPGIGKNGPVPQPKISTGTVISKRNCNIVASSCFYHLSDSYLYICKYVV
jgi:hypothetical protein